MDKLNANQIALAWLNSVNGVGNGKIEKLLEYFGSPKELWYNFEEERHNLNILDFKIINELIKKKDNFEYKLIKKLEEQNAKIITYFDLAYPKKLRNINGAPYILYYKGNLNCANNLSIAVIGSRKATNYGKWVAGKFTKELSELGVTIVSGLATGIDTIAHKNALKYNAKTIGIIGCGINVIYPKKNEELYNEILKNDGVIITEFPFDMKPMPANFPIRNRIISGLSDGVLVIEAQEKSGTLITVSHAANQGKDIFAVPGNIDSLYSKGTNALIKDGAKITTCLDDIIEEILELKNLISCKNKIFYNNLNENEIKIIDSLKSGEKTIFDINNSTNISTNDILSTITMLEMKGIVLQLTGNKYRLADLS
ncbi:DNA-processing protein DprA [Sedimentibacter sp. MB31-C6]|uniref:DNA-processing protein DprA n=1 Tax=Sedimentibacter sp. MB31-C6 TaxID=3109366 RepID=UPI002DDDA380|nr:DNA-processing protein DprA [Sedimentibacter sp. MB36-C1]WSI04284.1 DNA-processing protein DprA [Sedimentibacter sp. MB36-C1]